MFKRKREKLNRQNFNKLFFSFSIGRSKYFRGARSYVITNTLHYVTRLPVSVIEIFHEINLFLFILVTGPRYRKPKVPKVKGESEEKRPRTAFSMDQLARLKVNFIKLPSFQSVSLNESCLNYWKMRSMNQSTIHIEQPNCIEHE